LNNKVLIIVPAYNESSNIAEVINSIYNLQQGYDILVIDDGSVDNTFTIASETNKCKVIRLYLNLGIGGAVQTGFKFAQKFNYDIAVQFDGDGQHVAEEIEQLVKQLADGYDMVIGSRFIYKGENFKSSNFRRFGIKIFEYVNSILIKQRITDNTSGFRAFNKKVIEFLALYYPEDYPEPEAVVLLGKCGFKIKEIPVRMNSRKGGKSSIAGFNYINYFLKVLLSVLLTNFRPKSGYKI
jgi:glycosyltransferase involved in cell wall biosynthesis